MTKTPVANRGRTPATAPASDGGLSSIPSWWLWLALFVAAFAIYWPALRGAFLWDDDGHVTPVALRSLGGLGRIWFDLGATQQYYPVLHSAFWLEQWFFKEASTGYHVMNVLQHATAAGLFVVLLRRLAVPGAWFAAFLFLAHPVCVESVAWISEQKNTLSLVFYLIAALAYLRFDANQRPAHYVVATLCFLLALGTKTVTASLPAALLVIFWWQRGRLDLRRDVLPLIPWFALAAGMGALTVWVEHSVVGAKHNEYELDLVQRVLLASRVAWFYFGKLLYPVDLMFWYPRWTIDPGVAWQYLFPLGILALVGAAWRWRQHRGPIAAGLLFVGALFPALGFVNVYPFVFSFVADHFQYLASLGIFALAGAGLAMASARWARGGVFAGAVGLIVVLGILARQQSAIYRDNVTLYEHTLVKNPDAWMAHNNLGNELDRAGRPAEALRHYEAAARLRPESAEVENNWGLALINSGNPTAALPHLERAQKLRPDYIPAYNSQGLALLKLGRLVEAEKPLQTALKYKADFAEARFHLGLVVGQLGRNEEAITHFREAARLRPGHPDPHFNLAIALTFAGRPREAFPAFERAIQLAPNRPDYMVGYGGALLRAGQVPEAVERYRAAVALAPGSAEVHYYLATALQELGRTDEAARHLVEARRLGWRN